MTPDAIAVAKRLAEHGLAVFPCHASKVPATPRGFRDAIRDPAGVANLWRHYPGPLVGVATGAISGIAVLDIDRQHDGAAWFAANREKLPATRTHRTRSGGLHLFFRHREGLRCSTSRIAPGVDVRAEGGCVIWWPAVVGLPVLRSGPLAAWPDWLAQLAAPPPAPVVAPSVGNLRHISRYAEAAIRRAVDRVAGTREGGRNHALNAETYSLMRLAREGIIGAADVAAAMAAAGLAAGLDRRAVEATIASAMRAGGAA